jgi:hypothetical protein
MLVSYWIEALMLWTCLAWLGLALFGLADFVLNRTGFLASESDAGHHGLVNPLT